MIATMVRTTPTPKRIRLLAITPIKAITIDRARTIGQKLGRGESFCSRTSRGTCERFLTGCSGGFSIWLDSCATFFLFSRHRAVARPGDREEPGRAHVPVRLSENTS